MAYGPTIDKEHLVCNHCGRKTAVEFHTKVRVCSGMFCRNCDEVSYKLALKQQNKARRESLMLRVQGQN